MNSDGNGHTLPVGQPEFAELGHEVIVAHAPKVRLIVKSRKKMIASMHERGHGWRESIPGY